MEKARNILMTVYCLLLLIAGTIYICGDYLEMDMSLLSDSKQSNTVVQMVMVLLTLALIPLALRLFKFARVHRQLQAHPSEALTRWGLLRLAMLGSMLVGNTILYYIYGFEPAFGYLAVMVLLTMPFVFPSMNRCEAETTDDPTSESLVVENAERGGEEA